MLTPAAVSKALFQSLKETPRLIGDLPEARAFDAQSLIEPEAPHPLNLRQKLGHLYEDAMAVMLDTTPRYDLLGQSIQLQRDAGQTLGELDFIMRDRKVGQLIHLELAVKFYLAVETNDGLLLPGPDARDNYFRKLEKMRSHQLPLTSNHHDLLPNEFRDEKMLVQQLVHGCIFNHVHAAKPAEAEFLNPNGRHGKWLHAKDCMDYFDDDILLKRIPKALWPAPMELLDDMELEPWDRTQEEAYCVMVRAEADRCPYFIAPNGYPAH